MIFESNIFGYFFKVKMIEMIKCVMMLEFSFELV